MKLEIGMKLRLAQGGLVEVIYTSEARARVKTLRPVINDFQVGEKQVHFQTYREWDICPEVDNDLIESEEICQPV